MSIPGRSLSQRRQRLIPACVAAIILGIVGMHVLMQHCPTPSHVSAGGGWAEMAHHADEMLVAAAPMSNAGVDLVEATGQHGSSMKDVLMLCAAMLLGAGVLLLLLFNRQADRPLALLPLRPTDWRPFAAVIGTGPPTAFAFSVIRC